jgi:hypothetical protein
MRHLYKNELKAKLRRNLSQRMLPQQAIEKPTRPGKHG